MAEIDIRESPAGGAVAAGVRSAAAPVADLVRELGRWDLLALVVNTIVGSGIFGLPSRVFALAGSYSLLAYLACAVPVVLIVLCFAEVSSRFRETGGPYLYARTAFGSLAGFEVGWLLWLARVSAFAALCNLFVSYFAYFIPPAGTELWRRVIIIGVVSLLTAINIAGVRMTATVTNALTIGKLLPLLLFVSVGLFFIEPARYSFVVAPSYHQFTEAALLLLFAYTGFEVASISAGETRDPQRDVPFALLAGIAFVVLLYVSIQFVSIGTLGALATSERPLADAAEQFLGGWGAMILAVGALLSLAGTMNATVFAVPRILFAMAEEGQLPRVFTAVHPRFRTPHVAIAASSALMLGLTLFSSFISAATLSAVIRLLVYISTCVALPALRRKPGAPPPAFRTPAGLAVAIGGCVLSGWLLTNTTWREARVVLTAAVIGLLLHAFAGRRASSTIRP